MEKSFYTLDSSAVLSVVFDVSIEMFSHCNAHQNFHTTLKLLSLHLLSKKSSLFNTHISSPLTLITLFAFPPVLLFYNSSQSLNSYTNNSQVLIAGLPLDQKVVQYGPFVLNTQAEVQQAMMDFRTHSNGFERAAGWSSEIGKRMLG